MCWRGVVVWWYRVWWVAEGVIEYLVWYLGVVVVVEGGMV